MCNYTIKSLKKQEIDVISPITGAVKAKIIKEKAGYVGTKPHTKGRRKVMITEILEITKELSSNEIDMLNLLIQSTNSNCYCMNRTAKKHLSNKDIEEKLELSKKVVSNGISKLKKLGVIKKQGRKILFSPYLYTPYGVNDLKLSLLQDWWDSDFKYDVDLELELIEEQIKKELEFNTPKSKTLNE